MSSPLLTQLLADIKDCMKTGQKDRLSCLRLLHSDIKKVSIDSHQEISDEIILDVLAKSLKQRQDSLQAFQAGNRADLVEQAQNEITWIKNYLPQQLSQAELTSLVQETLAQLGATSKKDMGRVMAALSAQTKGRADGKILSQLVSQLLTG